MSDEKDKGAGKKKPPPAPPVTRVSTRPSDYDSLRGSGGKQTFAKEKREG